MHILIAPNAFKNALNATDAADAIALGLKQSGLECTSECFPVGDGGDGTGELIVKKCDGEFITAEVHGPLGKKLNARFGLIDNGETAIIEMAEASGIRLLKADELHPLRATSFGTGELILRALDKNVNKIIITMGGSATVDGGAGILKALGARFFDKQKRELAEIPTELANLTSIDLSGLDNRVSGCEFIVLCDVNNMLLGDKGSAAVFSPQKGATPAMVKVLEQSLAVFSQVSVKQTGRNMAQIEYGGTAGGAAAGLYAFLNAKLVNGIDYFLQLTNFNESLRKSSLVITGEGNIDLQTLQGKGPFGVALQAKKLKIPVIGLAGKVPDEQDKGISEYFDVLLPIGNEPATLAAALENTFQNLVRTSAGTGSLIKIINKLC